MHLAVGTSVGLFAGLLTAFLVNIFYKEPALWISVGAGGGMALGILGGEWWYRSRNRNQ